MNYNDIAVPATQRALVLQGGGALGAYEVGVLKVLFDKLIEGKGSGKKEGHYLISLPVHRWVQ